MTDTALHVENLRGYPQGEIFLLNRANQSVMAYHPMRIHRVSTYEFRAGRLPRHTQSRGREPSAVITR
jgi:hypothetical protein